MSRSSLLHRLPLSLTQHVFTETRVRPAAAELSVCAREEGRSGGRGKQAGCVRGAGAASAGTPCLLLLRIIPGTQVLGRGREHNMDLPSGEISICSTHECGMSKLLSSSSLPCWEMQGWGGLVLVRAGPWKRSHGQTLCLASQGQASIACQHLQGSQRSWAVLSWPGVIQDGEEVEDSVLGQLGPLLHPLAGTAAPLPCVPLFPLSRQRRQARPQAFG